MTFKMSSKSQNWTAFSAQMHINKILLSHIRSVFNQFYLSSRISCAPHDAIFWLQKYVFPFFLKTILTFRRVTADTCFKTIAYTMKYTQLCPVKRLQVWYFCSQNDQLHGTSIFLFFICYLHFVTLTHYTKAWCGLPRSNHLARVSSPPRTVWCQSPSPSVVFVLDTQKEVSSLCPQI